MTFYNDNQASPSARGTSSEIPQTHRSSFNDEFKGFDFKVGDSKFRVKVGDVNKTT